MRAIAAVVLILGASMSAYAVPIQWTTGTGANGHWYEFINVNVTGSGAFAAAAGHSYLGMQGYLATVTSAEENTFISNLAVVNGIKVLAWLGGSDTGNAVNVWTWQAGPENGQLFTYTNWAASEPNNCCGGENYVHINWTTSGQWNDHGGPGNAGHTNGYVVEYSVPLPGAMPLFLVGMSFLGLSARRRKIAA